MNVSLGRWSFGMAQRGSALPPRARRFVRIFIRVWAALAIAFGVAFAVIGAIEWDRAVQSAGWPTAPGIVTESRAVHTTRSKRGRTTQSWSPRIKYRFEVAGASVEASRVSFRMGSGSEASVRELVARYPVGSTVTVHHSPEDPALACLDPGAGEWQWAPIALGALAVLVGAGALAVTLRAGVPAA